MYFSHVHFYISLFVLKFNGICLYSYTRTLSSYTVFTAVTSLLPYLPERFQKPQRRLEEQLQGVSETEPHWQTCVERTTGALGFAVGALYVEEHFSQQQKDEVVVQPSSDLL